MKPCHQNPRQERDQIEPDRIGSTESNFATNCGSNQISGFKFQASDSSRQTLRFQTHNFRLAPGIRKISWEPCELFKGCSRTRLLPRLFLGELSGWVILGRTKTISIPFLHLKCAKWNTPAEIMENPEPQKCNHVRLRAAMFYTRRGLGLGEFSKRTPSNKGLPTKLRWKVAMPSWNDQQAVTSM